MVIILQIFARKYVGMAKTTVTMSAMMEILRMVMGVQLIVQLKVDGFVKVVIRQIQIPVILCLTHQ